VNQDPLNNGKIQYMPAMDVDDGGGVNILFYDDRFTTSDSAGVMLARSTDGGTNWQEVVVSDHRFKPVPIVGGASGYQGDHIALKAIGNRLAALWMDDFSGIYQAWCSFISLGPDGVEGLGPDVPPAFALDNNYPNPFNPETNITCRLAGPGLLTVSVFDVLGRKVRVLMQERQEAGVVRLQWDGIDERGRGVAGGMYLLRMEVLPDKGGGAVRIVRKMLIAR
jgi:hypothetical protein